MLVLATGFGICHAADEVEMLGGTKMSGKVVAETDDAVTFESEGATVKLDTAMIRALTVNGMKREFQPPAPANAKAGTHAAAAATLHPGKCITIAEAPPELRKKLLALLDDAKRDAREKIRIGTEKALALYPKMAPEMAALMRSSSTQETWLKVIVDSAFKCQRDQAEKCAALFTTDELRQANLESQYVNACNAIRAMRDVETGLQGEVFIEDYIAQAIQSSVGVLPPDKPVDGKPAKRHLVHRIIDASGIVQPGGN